MSVETILEELRGRIQRLEDESAIRRMMAEMLRKADERDNPQWGMRLVEYYTEDGQWKSGSGFGNVGMAERGHAALVKKFTAGTRICESAHLLGSESLEVEGDEANGTWLCFEPATLKQDDGTLEAVWIMGRYTCEFRREQGAWKVRTVQFDGLFCTPYEKGWAKERFASIAPTAPAAS